MTEILDDPQWLTAMRTHLMDMHGYGPDSVIATLDGEHLRELHTTLDHTAGHLATQGVGHRALVIAATSKEAYEAACEAYEDFHLTYQTKRTYLIEQLAALDDEYKRVASELSRHEDHGGIPLYNRCPRCTPGRALPVGHEGPCR